MNRYLLCTCGVLGLVASSASAQYVFGDHEGSDPGTWGYWDSGVQTPIADDPTLEFSSEDASSGSMSIKASNQGYDQNLAYAADFATREAFLENDTLLFDVIFPEYSSDGFWEVFEFVINSNAGFNALAVTGGDGSGNQVFWGPDGAARRVVTFEVDYSSQVAQWNGSVPNYLELVISLNNDSVHNIAYLDNFRLVPAPSSIGVLGLAGLAAVRRRR